MNDKKKKGEAILKKARRAVVNGNNMIQKNRVPEAFAALGKAYAALHFINNLWKYNNTDMKCYQVINEFRRDGMLKQIDTLAEKIYLMGSKRNNANKRSI